MIGEAELEEILMEILQMLDSQEGFAEMLGDREPSYSLKSLATFADAGVLSRNSGLVLRLEDNATEEVIEFQLTIVQSRYPRSEEVEGDDEHD